MSRAVQVPCTGVNPSRDWYAPALCIIRTWCGCPHSLGVVIVKLAVKLHYSGADILLVVPATVVALPTVVVVLLVP